MNTIVPSTVARLITRCGCTREVQQGTPFPELLRVPLTMDVPTVLRLDDGTLFELFADEGTHRAFVLDHVERTTAAKVVGVYLEKGTTIRET